MTPQQIELALETIALVLEDLKKTQEKQQATITALKEALAEHAMRETQRLGQEIEQEPVAIKRMKEWIEYLKRKSDFGQHMKIPSEMSAGACWELAIELEQFINTTPPQRTWSGLTNQEQLDIFAQSVAKKRSEYEHYKAIEQALKEKNT